MQNRVIPIATVLLAACGGQPKKDPGPAPGSDHQEQVRAAMEQYMRQPPDPWTARYDGTPSFLFSAPVPERVARWVFEPQPAPGKSHGLGYVHGWRVDFRYTPRFVGIDDPQPEARRMAFFRDGKLLGVFTHDERPDVPLDLAKWGPVFVSPEARITIPASPGETRR